MYIVLHVYFKTHLDRNTQNIFQLVYHLDKNACVFSFHIQIKLLPPRSLKRYYLNSNRYYVNTYSERFAILLVIQRVKFCHLHIKARIANEVISHYISGYLICI